MAFKNIKNDYNRGNSLLSYFVSGKHKQYHSQQFSDAEVPPVGLTATGGVISDYTSPPGAVYRAHVFTSSGTFTVTAPGGYGDTVEYLVVAGGGGGGSTGNGGGGRGGLGGLGDGTTNTGVFYQGTPGGTGGIGGRGIGYNQALSSGNSGQPGSDIENRGTGGAGGMGGTGGNWGTSGDVGQIGANGTVSNGLSGYLAGSSGNYIVGNSNVTWITTGTRAGGVA